MCDRNAAVMRRVTSAARLIKPRPQWFVLHLLRAFDGNHESEMTNRSAVYMQSQVSPERRKKREIGVTFIPWNLLVISVYFYHICSLGTQARRKA